jgi:ribosomal protein L37E
MFSPRLTREFLDAINFQTTENEELESMSRKDGYFFCIRCGTKMDKIDVMHEKCMVCGFEIGRSTYFQIIELNPIRGFNCDIDMMFR